MKCLLLLLPLMTTEVFCDVSKIFLTEQLFNNCTREPSSTYVEAMKNWTKEDGEPDYRARKSCNYITSVEHCADRLRESGSQEEDVTRLKDFHIGNIIRNLNTTVLGWDSCKCPPVKAHINRTSAVHGAEHACPEKSAEQPCRKYANTNICRLNGQPVENSSTSSTVISALLLLHLLIIHQLL